MSVALVIQHPKHMRLAVLSSVACPDRPPFSTQSNKRHDLGNVIEYKLFVLIFCTTLSELFIVVSSTVCMYKRRHEKWPSFLSDFNEA